MRREQRWQDWVALVFGVWFFISPWILGFADMEMAAWNSYIIGIAVAVFSIIALARPQQWEEWVNILLGIWLILSPFVLGFAESTSPLANAIILGLLIGIDAVWAMSASPVQRPATR